MSDTTTRMQESFDLERAKSRESQDRNDRDRNQKYEGQLKSQSEEYNQRLNQIRQDAQNDVRKLKDEMYDSNGKSKNTELQALQTERNQLNQYREDTQKEFDRKANKVDQGARDLATRSSQNEGNKVEDALAAQKQSHAQELSALQDELAQYKVSGNDIDREKAVAKQSSIAEYEGDRIKERDRIVAAYERAIARLHQKQDEMGENYSRRLTDSTLIANEKAQGQLRNQKSEFTKIDQDRRKEMERIEGQFDQEIKNEKSRNDRSTNTLIGQSTNDKEKALLSKDEAYQNYLKENKSQNDFERTSRDQELQSLRTTSDPTKVSPFVLDKIEKGAETRYHDQLTEVQALNQRNLSAVRERDAKDRQELQHRYQSHSTQQSRESQRGQDIEKKQFQAAYDDLQYKRAEEKGELEHRYQKTLERNLDQSSAAAILDQERHKEDLENQRETLHADKARLEEDLTTRNKTENREWATKFNEVRRGFEGQLNDERDQNALKTSELRLEFDKKLRDSNRTAQRTLEERVKMYDHQLKQQELTFKEKERFLTEHYEEELDRMKQSNARLIQTKS